VTSATCREAAAILLRYSDCVDWNDMMTLPH
jgi:hypothetical protein